MIEAYKRTSLSEKLIQNFKRLISEIVLLKEQRERAKNELLFLSLSIFKNSGQIFRVKKEIERISKEISQKKRKVDDLKMKIPYYLNKEDQLSGKDYLKINL